jgi:hypothetical protein
MGRIVHTLKREYVSQDDDLKMSLELEAYMKGVTVRIESLVVSSTLVYRIILIQRTLCVSVNLSHFTVNRSVNLSLSAIQI